MRKPGTKKFDVFSQAATYVPCVRVMSNAAPGIYENPDADGCIVTGVQAPAVRGFALRRDLRATSKTVATPKKNVPCGTTRQGCPVQLAFDRGQPFLRFCSTPKKPGYRVDVNSSQEGRAAAAKYCAQWDQAKQFSFPENTPLGRRSSRRRRR